MRVSIIIPAHNEEKYIASTLEAVLKQDYPDFEVIVVDNNSSDRTSEIAKSFSRVKVVQEFNKGTNWARERGRKESTGEIIVTLDSDCILPTDKWLSTATSILMSKADVVAVSGPYDYYDLNRLMRTLTFLTQKYVYYLTNQVLNFFGKGAVIIGGNVLIKADCLTEVGGFNTAYTFYGDDTDTAKRLSQFGRVIFTSKITVKSSGRRFIKQGIFNLTFKYFLNFVKVLFLSGGKIVGDNNGKD